ncbi:MAG: nucleoside triphosphate pyrophosphohydrolase [Paludibacteraceae bacterium]|jgi:MazG family protein|nr:nucleoside triphosphate pyrophosphohydrolase [Paludibacteraceae bacterium]
MQEEKLKAFERALDILDRLRIECPWDKKQTNDTLRILTIEETFELADAIIKNDEKEIKLELGDILLHILFYAKIAEEKNQFNIADVCNTLCDKLIYRHPHIFSSAQVDNSEQVIRNWEILKLREGKNKTVLCGVPSALPSIIKSHRIQDKARGVGFDWSNKEDVWNKVKEEINELSIEIDNKDQDKIEEEFGDVLFSVINAARLYKVNPDNALERTNQKFIKRFNYIENELSKKGIKINDASLEEMDKLWNEAKTNEKKKINK